MQYSQHPPMGPKQAKVAYCLGRTFAHAWALDSLPGVSTEDIIAALVAGEPLPRRPAMARALAPVVAPPAQPRPGPAVEWPPPLEPKSAKVFSGDNFPW